MFESTTHLGFTQKLSTPTPITTTLIEHYTEYVSVNVAAPIIG